MRDCCIIITVIICILIVYLRVTYNPFKNKNVVIVGNSKELLQQEMGHVIDSHDIVIRLNNYKLDGYEKYTGTKTDGVHMNYYSIPPSRIHGILRNNRIQWMGTRNKIGFCLNAKLNPFDNRIFQYDPKVLPCRSPTSGTAALADILRYCNRPVSIIGLGGYTDRGYYYKESDEVVSYNTSIANKRHCPQKEKLFMEKLIQDGKVRKLTSLV